MVTIFIMDCIILHLNAVMILNIKYVRVLSFPLLSVISYNN